MKKIVLFLSLYFLVFSCQNEVKKESEIPSDKTNSFAIVIHGGAGDGLIKGNFDDEIQKVYTQKLQEALDSGFEVLENSGSSIDAIQAAICVLENSPLFNAGKGAVYNIDGNQEMDASIMAGNTLNSGAVAGINHVKNPILAARIVMDSTAHVMLSGKGAEQAMEQFGLEMVDSTYFFTSSRYNELKRIKLQENDNPIDYNSILNKNFLGDRKYGTVGAVAIDKEGNIAAGTSTGGMTNKKYGRIGDSPIIGAGTYANNLTCGISATGTGEYFIRTVAAHEVSNLIQYKKVSPQDALHEVLNNQIGKLGGKGGMILLDKNANIFWDFNTKGMFRGYKKSTGENVVEMFGLD
ncbi:isoaspartyl peptidase/L-asparaginase family protein [Seonamhaeicola maritimus]|uniref:isoaspartyl peptidase/L-asparaginase family protein n=1 Tax=Seonamhaeicola maritimus TaxID=2591822 RepID=UPI0024949D3E|nr:isoaspartyl peptidase/L-asparaginase [Seonamhaeicola maritimus]